MENEKNNIIFFGASKLGYKCCEVLLREKIGNIKAIVTSPQKFTISYSPEKVNNVLHEDFSILSSRYNVPLITIENNIKDYIEEIKYINPSLLIAIGWYYLIPKPIRDIAIKGCIGIHGSLLPKYRGGAPLVWAMINGESKTGISLFYFENEVDAGDIIEQRTIEIEENDYIKDILAKVEMESLDVVKIFIPKILNGTAPRIKQNESEATYVPQRSPEDGEINWDWDSKKVKNFIRAQSRPYPGAFTVINGKKVTIWDAEVTEV